MKPCPYCAEQIQDEAIFCRYCNHDLRLPVSLPQAPPAQVGQRKRPMPAWAVPVIGLLVGCFAVAFALASLFNSSRWMPYFTTGIDFNVFWSAFWGEEAGLLILVFIFFFCIGITVAGAMQGRHAHE